MDDETRAKMAEAALLAVEDSGWIFLLHGISHAAELADVSDARAAYIRLFGDMEHDLLNDIGEMMEQVGLTQED